MAHELQYANGLIRFSLFGTVTLEDLLSAGEEARRIEAEAPVSPPRITDMSRVDDLDLDYWRMEEFAARRRIAPLKNKVRSAIVAPSQVQFGFARMFQTLNDNPLIEIRIFSEQAAAELWLDEKPVV
jgi:hypothetical protein